MGDGREERRTPEVVLPHRSLLRKKGQSDVLVQGRINTYAEEKMKSFSPLDFDVPPELESGEG